MQLLLTLFQICGKLRLLLTLLTVFSVQTLCGQSYRLFTTSDALPNTLVNDVISDANCMIWVGTEYGLCRYDGSKFTTYLYEEGNPNSLQNNYVRTLFVDSRGRLLVGTRSGLQVYRAATDDFSPLAKFSTGDYPLGDVTQIIERGNGEIWMSGNVPCCARIEEDGTPVLYPNAFTDKVNLTESISEDRQGRVWLNRSMRELYCLSPDGTLSRYQQDGRDMAFNRLYIGADSTIYAAGQESGLFCYVDSIGRFVQLPRWADKHYQVRDLLQSDSTHLLVATDNAGLQVYNLLSGCSWTYQFGDGRIDARSHKVHALCRDRYGVLWLSLYQRGVMMVPPQPQPFRSLCAGSARNNIGDKCITSMFSADDGKVWVSTDNGGLYALDVHGRQLRYLPYTGEKGQVPSSLVRVFGDSRGRLWYGTYSQGGGWVNPETGHCTPVTVGDRDAGSLSFYDYAEDHLHRIWTVTMGAGVMCYDEQAGTFRIPFVPDSCCWSNCCYFDPERKSLYVGSYNGLTVVGLDSDSLPLRQYAGSFIIYSIAPCDSVQLALCTSEGLLIFDRESGAMRHFTMADGLPSNMICSARADSLGRLWIASNAGLSCYDAARGTFTNYTVHDGLHSNEFYKHSSMTDCRGRLWFGGTSGITSFDPLAVTQDGDSCQVRIVSILAGGREVRSRETREFADNSLTFEMATLPLHRTGHAVYSYSFDNDPWISLQQGHNRVSFSHIAPGRHTFRYKAQVSDIESQVQMYCFSVTYPWYRSWWATTIIVLLLIVIVYMSWQQVRHRRQVRRRLAQHVQQQAINEAKLQFFMNIAHEIRTPMTMIVSPLQKLLSTDNDPDRHHAYTMMQRNAARIVGTINQLMDLRKIDKRQMQLYCSETDIAITVRELCESMQDVADVRRVSLRLEQHTPEGLRMWVDTSHFDKILINLLSNALKYTPAGGEVVVRTDVRPTANGAGDSFVLTVTDTGEGVPDAEKPRIFDRFYQVRSTAAGKGGTGIGLHLTASLVRLHHGTIEVSDNPEGHGACFTVTLPLGNSHLKPNEMASGQPSAAHLSGDDASLIAPDAYVAEETEVNGPSASRSVIVVAEDDDEIREYIVRELSNACQVVAFANGREALDHIMRQPVDLVLSDVMMPEMDGFELCRKIRDNVRLNHLPVVLLTAKADEESRIESLDLGADAYLTKPFNMEVLRRTVQNLLRSRVSLRNTYAGTKLPVEQVDTPEGKSPDERLMERVMKVINQHLANPELTSELIAQEVGMSRVHLYRKLRELTGQTARSFITNIRIAKAAELLAQKKCSVAEVSEMVGFTNASNFATMFKRVYGMPPTQYMEDHIKGESSSVQL